MCKQKNPHNMMNWAIISAGANYGRGVGDMVNRRGTYLDVSSTTQSFLRPVKPHAESILSNVYQRLSREQKIVWTLDNNQKGVPNEVPEVWELQSFCESHRTNSTQLRPR